MLLSTLQTDCILTLLNDEIITNKKSLARIPNI